MLLRRSPLEIERGQRARLYYGWPMLVGLSAAETVSWGVLYYSFAVFIHPIEQEMGWTRTEVTGAFSLALLVAGLSAVPIGHWLDAHGARALMTTGAALGALLFGALAVVDSLPAFYAIWTGLGLVMAMVLYEPALAVVATWFVRHRDRALTVLTLFGGLASTLMVPLATSLLENVGWRDAVWMLAALLAATTIPVHGLLLRRAPSAVGQFPDGDHSPPRTEAVGQSSPAEPAALGPVLADRTFRGFTSALVLVSLATSATTVHLVPCLVDSGVPASTAGGVLGLVGIMQLPGRLLFAPLRRRLPWSFTAAAVFGMLATALAVLAFVPRGPGLALFAALFGAGNGMATLLRASTLAQLYGRQRYGRVSGVVSLVTTLGRATGPVLLSAAFVELGGYERAFAALTLVLLLVALLVHRVVPGQSPEAWHSRCKSLRVV